MSGARKLTCLWIRRSKCNLYGTRRASSPGVSLFSALPVLFLALTLPNQTHANGALNAYQVYDAQLCRATVEVIAFDLARLNENTAPAAVNRGLERRLRTFASPLVWLCRRAVTISPSSVRTTLTALQAAINARHWALAKQTSASLRQTFPFDPSQWAYERATVHEIEQAEVVYEQYCGSCHRSDTGGENPAERLDTLRQRSGETNFVARLVLGVHGTSVNGYRNPLTQKDIRGLNALMAR